MGLDTSHDCWHGPYSAFMRWREWLADLAGIPLRLMEGFCEWTIDDSDLEWATSLPFDTRRQCIEDLFRALRGRTPLKWKGFEHDPITLLLDHSDCDGEIAWQDAGRIADRIEQLIAGIPDDLDALKPARAAYDGNVPAARRWIKGLRDAFAKRENVEFR